MGHKEAMRPQCHEDSVSPHGSLYHRHHPRPAGQRPWLRQGLPALPAPQPSPPRAVLHCPMQSAPVSLQDVGTKPASHHSISLPGLLPLTSVAVLWNTQLWADHRVTPGDLRHHSTALRSHIHIPTAQSQISHSEPTVNIPTPHPTAHIPIPVPNLIPRPSSQGHHPPVNLNPSPQSQSHIPDPNSDPNPIPYGNREHPEAPPPQPLRPAPGLSLVGDTSGPFAPLIGRRQFRPASGLGLVGGSAAGSDWLRRRARERPLPPARSPPSFLSDAAGPAGAGAARRSCAGSTETEPRHDGSGAEESGTSRRCAGERLGPGPGRGTVRGMRGFGTAEGLGAQPPQRCCPHPGRAPPRPPALLPVPPGAEVSCGSGGRWGRSGGMWEFRGCFGYRGAVG